MKRIVAGLAILMPLILTMNVKAELNLKLMRKLEKLYPSIDRETICKVLDTINVYRKKIIPDLPLSDKDIVAIIMVESNFNVFAVGELGEAGLMQILDESYYSKSCIDLFDVKANIRAGLKVLKDKFKYYKTRKLLIIAYNGLVWEREKSKISEKYWNKFKEARLKLSNFQKKEEKNENSTIS